MTHYQDSHEAKVERGPKRVDVDPYIRISQTRENIIDRAVDLLPKTKTIGDALAKQNQQTVNKVVDEVYGISNTQTVPGTVRMAPEVPATIEQPAPHVSTQTVPGEVTAQTAERTQSSISEHYARARVAQIFGE